MTKIYLVGGAVRDKLIGREIHDKDYVVVGSTPEEMIKKGFNQVGKAFPVFINPQDGYEYALARKEIKTSQGHQGFEFDFKQEITLEEDLLRRDFTINAMALDEESGELIDHYNGQKDLENRIIKHVSDHFAEDPLRVIRGCRFLAQLNGFSLNQKTIFLMKKMSLSGELSTLSGERIFQEIEKALLSPNPELFFHGLQMVDALGQILPELSLIENTFFYNTLSKLNTSSKSVEIRFAILTHGLPLELLDILDERLKLTRNIKKLSSNIIKFHSVLLNPNEINEQVILDLLSKINAFRNETDLNNFINTMLIISKIYKKDISKIIQTLKQIVSEIKAMDFTDLNTTQTNPGAEIKENKLAIIKKNLT